MNISFFLKVFAALSITYLRRLANACTSTQYQDFRASAYPIGICIVATDCSGGVIIEEIKVCLDACPSNTTIQTDSNWVYSKCVCSSARISSDFKVCSDKCPNKEVAQQNTKLCLISYSQCTDILTQDRTMCGPTVCQANQYYNYYNGQAVCTCQTMNFLDLKSKECMDNCPNGQIINYQYQVCLVSDADCKLTMSSDFKTCGLYDVCKFNEYIAQANGNKLYGICSPCPDAFPLARQGNLSCYDCSPDINNLINGSCVVSPSQCNGNGIMSSDGKRCSKTCNIDEYIAQEIGYRQCRDMSECPFVDRRISPEICLGSQENCIGGFISSDRRSCISSCPIGQIIANETLVIQQQEIQYKKCIDRLNKIALISVGFGVFTALSSFFICQRIIRTKINYQEYKYIRLQYPSIIEEEEDDN